MRNHFLPSASALIAVGLLSASSAMAQIGTIDTFDTTLSTAYKQTTVLDNDTTRNVTFATSTGILQSTATTTAAAEQTLLLRSDFTLGVNQALRIDLPSFLTGSQDFGIAIGAGGTLTGVAAGASGDVRAGTGGYVFAGFRTTQNHFLAGGFNGGTTTTALATLQAGAGTGVNTTLVSITGLFISRTSANTFNVGYNDSNGPDVIVGSYTLTTNTVGSTVGFYSDMRGAGTIGNYDNLRITAIPEPSTWAMLIGGAGFLGLAMRVRRTALRS